MLSQGKKTRRRIDAGLKAKIALKALREQARRASGTLAPRERRPYKASPPAFIGRNVGV